MSGGGRNQRLLPTQELLDDLCSRFVLNATEEDLHSFDRMLFLMEHAHWFYEDYCVEKSTSLKSLTLREFTSLMFQSCAALRPYLGNVDDIYKDFTFYKVRVPVTGAIILDESYERCLLVKGWKPGSSWSFPRGKKNQHEEDYNCALREVWEETGYDMTSLLKVERHLEVVMGQQRMRLYIIPGVNEDTPFAPQTKKEVSEIAWHRVDELPVVATKDPQSHTRGSTGKKYFMVWPFVKSLNRWIREHWAESTASQTDSPLKGMTVWKVKPNGVIQPPVAPSAPPAALSFVARPQQELPGLSFRNFKFDRASVLNGLEVKYSNTQ